MPSCCDSKSPSSGEKVPIENKSKDCCKERREQPGALSKLSSASPVLSALLSSSCCWLPVVLDFLSVGSASVTIFRSLKPLFLLVTIAVLSWDVYKRGVTQRTVTRIAVSGLFIAWPHLLDLFKRNGAGVAETAVHKCH